MGKRSGILVLVLLFLLTLEVCAVSFLERVGRQEIQFLRQNMMVLELEDDELDFHLTTEELEQHHIFLIGEGHGVAINGAIDLAFLKSFHEKAQVRYYLVEGGYALGRYLNKFVQEGDREILDMVFTHLQGTSWWTVDQYEKWLSIREFNRNLPQEDRIEIIGIDMEVPFTLPLMYLHELLPKEDPPMQISASIRRLKNLYTEFKDLQGDDIYSREVRVLVSLLFTTIKEEMKVHPHLYNRFLGENSEEFALIVDNIVNAFSIWSKAGVQQNILRERISYENFLRISSQLHRGKVLAQWGSSHVLQRQWRQVNWLASLLAGPDSPWEDRVLTFLLIYENCERLEFPSYQTLSYSTEWIENREAFYSLTPHEVTLFRLTSEESPFQEELFFLQYHTRGVTTDYFQNIILVQNSPASKPLKQ